MCIPMQENVMGSKKSYQHRHKSGETAMKHQHNDITLDSDVSRHLCTFKMGPAWSHVMDSSLLFSLSGRIWNPPMSHHLSSLPTGRLIFPIPSFLLSGGPAGAGCCCDITIGGRGPYHPSKLRCPLDAFNILLIKIAECSTITRSHYSGRGSL